MRWLPGVVVSALAVLIAVSIATPVEAQRKRRRRPKVEETKPEETKAEDETTDEAAEEPAAEAPAPAPEPAPAPPPEARPEPKPAPAPAARPKPAPPPAPAATTDDGAGDGFPAKTRAILFSLNNVLVNNAILSSYRGLGLAGQMELSEGMSVRGGFDITYNTNPVRVEETTVVQGGQTVTSHTVNTAGPTSNFGLVLAADVLLALASTDFAPYAGVGLSFDMNDTRTAYVDDLTVTDQRTAVNNVNTGRGVGLRGLMGLSWRFHEHFSIFAEYLLNVSIWRWSRQHDLTVVENTGSGTAATMSTTSDIVTTRWMNTSSGLGQGGSLGLIAWF